MWQDHIDKTASCWLWTGAKSGNGYGSLTFRSKRFSAHRFVYSQLVGEIPSGKVLDHTCRVKHCVNPAHLRVVTQRENCSVGISPAWITHRTGICKRGHVIDDHNVKRDPRGGNGQCLVCYKNAVQRAANRKRRVAI